MQPYRNGSKLVFGQCLVSQVCRELKCVCLLQFSAEVQRPYECLPGQKALRLKGPNHLHAEDVKKTSLLFFYTFVKHYRTDLFQNVVRITFFFFFLLCYSANQQLKVR